MKQYSWFDLYRVALLELDSSKIPERIALARQTLNARLQELHPSATAEQQAIYDALSTLHAVEVNEQSRGQTRQRNGDWAS